MKRNCSRGVCGLAILVLTAGVTLHLSGCLGSSGGPPPPSPADLADMTLSDGTLSPVFMYGYTSYTVNVANTVTSLTVTPTASEIGATITVNGDAVVSGAPSLDISLAVGANTITIVVTATDGVIQKTYTISVTRAPGDAELADLTTSTGTLSPAFASGTTSYTDDVANSVASLTVTPTASDSGATIMVNGDTVASGAQSLDINLAVGANAITVVVTATDGVTQKAYTISVTREEADATLADLTTSAGTLSPVFSSAATFYTVFVADSVTSLTATPTASDPGVTITVNGDTVASGAPSPDISLAADPETITIVVTAIDGVTQRVYTVVVVRFGQQAYLKASNTGGGDCLGYSVAVDGDTVVVGARGEDNNTGAAYVFTRSSGVWTQQAFLKASNIGAGDWFGYSVAVAGDTIVVGGHYEDSDATGVNGDQTNDDATYSGAAYVFTRSGSVWTQQAYLKASNAGMEDYFGWSVGIDGDTIVVGAKWEDSNATGVNGEQTDNSIEDSGAVYVFTRSGSVWSQQAYLKASNTRTKDWFGYSLAIDGDTVIVGVNGEDSNATGVDGEHNYLATRSGAAYIFTRSGSVWSQQAYLKASNTDSGDYFGVRVAIDGDTVVVGALTEESNATGVDGDQANNDAGFSGAAYVFTRSGSAWSQQAYLKASNTGPGDTFGISVAVDGDMVVVGAYREASSATGMDGDQTNDDAEASGAVYVFTRSGSVWSQQAYLKASNTGDNDYFGCSVGVNGGTVVVGAWGEDSNAMGVDGDQTNNDAGVSGAAYVFE